MHAEFKPDPMLRVKQVADILSVSMHIAYRAIAEGKLTALRINQRTIRIRASDLRTFLESCEIRADLDFADELLDEAIEAK